MAFINTKTEEYYRNFIELQEKLRRSEEERLKLEMRFNEMMRVTKEEEQAHYRKLRSKYKRFLEEDRRRQERNEKLLRTLEIIENRITMLMAKSERFKLLRQQYHILLDRIYSAPKQQEIEKSEPIIKDTQTEDLLLKDTAATESTKNNSEEVLKNYLETLSSQRLKDLLLKKDDDGAEVRKGRLPGDPSRDLNKSSFSLGNPGRDLYRGYEESEFRPNYANSIADDIINSIYSRGGKRCDEFPKDGDWKISQNLGPYSSKTKEEYKKVADDSEDRKYYTPKEMNIGPDYNLKSQNFDSYCFKKTEEIKKPDVNRKVAHDCDGTSEENYEAGEDRTYYVTKELPRKKLIPETTKSKKKFEEDVKEIKLDYKTKEEEQKVEAPKPPEITTSKTEKLPAEKSIDKPKDADDLDTFQQTIQVASNLTEEVESYQPPISDQKVENPDFSTENISIDQQYQEKSQILEQYDETGQSIHAYGAPYSQLTQQYEENYQQYDQNGQYNDIQEPNIAVDQQYQEESEIFQQYDETGQFIQHYDQNGQPIQNQAENIPINQQYDETRQSTQQYEENGQSIQQYNESTQPIQQYNIEECQGQLIQQYDQNGQPIQRHNPIPTDETGQSTKQYNESTQPIQQYKKEEQLQQQKYDEDGQLIQQYDQTEKESIQHYEQAVQPLQQFDENLQSSTHYDKEGYDETGQSYHQQYTAEYQHQYDENGQPIQLYGGEYPQYDESGQPIQQYAADYQQYDENGQPIIQQYGDVYQQYDENGQPIQQYDAQYQQYDESGHVIQQYDDQGQTVSNYQQDQQYISGPTDQQYQNQELSREVVEANVSGKDQSGEDEPQHAIGELSIVSDEQQASVSEKSGEEIMTSEENGGENKNPGDEKKGVMEMLDTDTESVKQESANKVSNESDFDFSNG